MQVEHKTEKGEILFVKVPDDLISVMLFDDLSNMVIEIKSKTGPVFLNSLYSEKWQNISIDLGFQLIGLTSDVTEEMANMMVDEDNMLYHLNAIFYKGYESSFSSPLKAFSDIIDGCLKLKTIYSKWIVLFKAN